MFPRDLDYNEIENDAQPTGDAAPTVRILRNDRDDEHAGQISLGIQANDTLVSHEDIINDAFQTLCANCKTG